MSDKISISLRIEKDLHRFFKKNSEGNLTKYLTSLMVRGAVVDIEELYTNAIGTTKIEELKTQKDEIRKLENQIEKLEMELENSNSSYEAEKKRLKEVTSSLDMDRKILTNFFLSFGMPIEVIDKQFQNEKIKFNDSLLIAKGNQQLLIKTGQRLGFSIDKMKSWFNL